jgi:hypothetical protein
MGEIRERGRTGHRYFLVEFNQKDNIEKRLRWLRRNIQDKVNEVGKIHFYIWLGICNLTTKDKSVYISMAFTETNDAIAVITNLFKQFIEAFFPTEESP